MRTLISTALLVAVMATPLASCAFCAQIPGVATAQGVLAKHAIVALGRPVTDGAGRLTHVALTSVLLGAPKARIDQVVPISRPETLEDSRTYLVLSRSPALRKATVRAIDKIAARFFEAVAALPPRPPKGGPQRERLRFFLRYLGYPHKVIAASVSEEFAKADYATVRALRPELRLGRLVRCLEDPDRFALHHGLAYLMVGIVGGDAGLEHLERWLQDPKRRKRVGFDGLVGAYLLARGTAGLSRVINLRPAQAASKASRRWFAQSLVRALDFHARSESVLDRATIARTLEGLLAFPDEAGFAVDALRALKVWESWPRIAELLRRAPEKSPRAQAARRFLKACPDPKAKVGLD